MNNKSLQLFAWVDSRYYREIRSLAADETNMSVWDKINKITWHYKTQIIANQPTIKVGLTPRFIQPIH